MRAIPLARQASPLAGPRVPAPPQTPQRRNAHVFWQEHDAREAQRDAAAAAAIHALGTAMDQWNRKALPVLDEARRTLYSAALDLASAILQREIEPGSSSARTLLDRALYSPHRGDSERAAPAPR